MIFVGIDPGLTGAAAFIDDAAQDPNRFGFELTPTLVKTQGRGARMYNVSMMPTILSGQLPSWGVNECHVFIEKQQPFREQGLSSTFSTGRGFGLWEGIICGLGLPYTIVHPKTWQKIICDGLSGGPKEKALQSACAFAPGLDMRAHPRCRIAHQGIVDAICIAEYGRRTWSRNE